MAVAPLLAPRSRLLLCLDLQRPDADGPSPVRQLDNCRRLLAHGRVAGWAICHVYHRNPSAAHAASAAPIEGLSPLPTEPVFHRPGVSAFSSGAFAALVGGLPHPEIVIVGLSLMSSCLATALAAFDKQIAATLVEDAVAAGAMDAEGLAAMESVARSIASPFVRLARTDDLIDRRRGLRVVSG